MKTAIVRRMKNRQLKVILWLSVLIIIALLVLLSWGNPFGLAPFLIFLLASSLVVGWGGALLAELISKSDQFTISLSRNDHMVVAISLALFFGFFLAHQAHLMPKLLPSAIVGTIIPELLFYIVGLVLTSLGYLRGYKVLR